MRKLRGNCYSILVFLTFFAMAANPYLIPSGYDAVSEVWYFDIHFFYYWRLWFSSLNGASRDLSRP